MANLRTNNLSGEQGQNAYRGSVHFPQVHNSTDYLQLDPNDNPANQFNFLHNGTTDFTIEFWIHPKQGNNRQTVFSTGGNSSVIGFAVRIMEDGASGGSNGYKVLCQFSRGSSGNYLGFLGGNIDNKGYSHVALVFTTSNKQLAIYINGQLTNSSDLDGTANGTFGSGDFSQGNHGNSGTFGREPSTSNLYLHQAHLSNFRIVKGKTVYTANFTPPQSELTVIDGTILLACQDSTDPTKDATGQIIDAYGQLASPDQFKILKHVPPFGVDAGNTFGGSIKQSSQGYMYFPTGGTVERGGARGLVSGGFSPGGHDSIDFTNIQSDGNAITFGNLSVASGYNSGLGSRTRGIITLQYQASPEATTNVIEFVTIATTSNTSDFGDMATSTYGRSTGSNDTRGIISGGAATENAMEFITIASLGNGSDFGDLTQGRREPQSTASSTRLVIGGGYPAPSPSVNTIDFVTIATTGNAQDFGDLTTARLKPSAFADPTRGVFNGGGTPSDLNVIDFITIASTGDATDFGDLLNGNGRGAGCSDHTRGITFMGTNPSNNNTIEVVTIQTTGNSKDFGDRTFASHGHGALSNGHGGLS